MIERKYLTKKEALKISGYKPKCGRPSISGEPTKNVPVRLPVSAVKKIPEPRGPWIRNVILKNLPE